MEVLTERKFKLKCELKFKKKMVHDVGRTYERELAYLVPEHTDEANIFFTAWLPEVVGEYFEIVGVIPYPVSSSCRLSIHRGPDDKFDRHYLFVMTKGVEDIMSRHMKEGQKILVEIQPDGMSAEDIADQAVGESEGNFQDIAGLD